MQVIIFSKDYIFLKVELKCKSLDSNPIGKSKSKYLRHLLQFDMQQLEVKIQEINITIQNEIFPCFVFHLEIVCYICMPNSNQRKKS